jgi:hypothetical protein
VSTGKLEGRQSPCYSWVSNFLKRHPELSLRKPQQLNSLRAKAMTRDKLNRFYDILRTSYKVYIISYQAMLQREYFPGYTSRTFKTYCLKLR